MAFILELKTIQNKHCGLAEPRGVIITHTEQTRPHSDFIASNTFDIFFMLATLNIDVWMLLYMFSLNK